MPTFKAKYLPQHPDLHALLLAEQISRDYTETLRSEVVPEISARYGLKLREIRVLMCIDNASREYMSAAEVADILRQDRATITRSAIILIGEKYIYTTPNLDDSRVKNLYLTDKGIEVAAMARDIFETAIQRAQETNELEASLLDDSESLSILRRLEKRTRTILLLVKRNRKLRR